MSFYLEEEDILAIIYPNKLNPEMLLIIDPFDKRIQQYSISSLEEAKEILKNSLPFCSQNHPPLLHFGRAYVVDWTDLRTSNIDIEKPEDIEKIPSRI